MELSKLQKKFVPVNLSRGFAYGLRKAEIPEGTWIGENMCDISSDNTLQTRFSYKNSGNEALGNIVSISPFTGGTTFCASNTVAGVGKMEYRAAENNWVNLPYLGAGGVFPTWSSNSASTWATVGTRYVFCHPGAGAMLSDAVVSNGFDLLSTACGYGNLSSGICASHENRIWIAQSGLEPWNLRFSDTGTAAVGYADPNYVGIGGATPITGLYEAGNNFYITKRDEIWAKLGRYSDIPNGNQFQMLQNKYKTEINVGCVGEGIFFFANASGVYAVEGTNITPIMGEWHPYWRAQVSATQQQYIRMGYWNWMRWLFVCASSNIGQFEHTFIFDLKRKKWYYWKSLSILGMASDSAITTSFLTAHYNSKQLREWMDLYPVGHASAAEATLSSYIRTPWLDLGNPLSEKYGGGIEIAGSAVDRSKAYLQTKEEFLADDAADYTLSFGSGCQEAIIPPERRFRRCSFELYNSANAPFFIKDLGVWIFERSMM